MLDMSVIKKSMSVSLLVFVISLLAAVTLTWYLSKKYHEGVIEKQRILEKMKKNEEKTLPQWMLILLTVMFLFAIQCILTTKDYFHFQRRVAYDPMRLESIQAPRPGWDPVFHRQRRSS